MKLCKKCIDFVLADKSPFNVDDLCKEPKPISESKCEFWAHKELNEQMETNIFAIASQLRRQLIPEAYTELLTRLASDETKSYIHINRIPKDIFKP